MENIVEYKGNVNMHKLFLPKEREELYWQVLIANAGFDGIQGKRCERTMKNMLGILSERDCIKQLLDSMYLDLKRVVPGGSRIHRIGNLMTTVNAQRGFIRKGQLPSCPTMLALEHPPVFGALARTMYVGHRDYNLLF
jgi:hypothetical protein